MRRILVNTVFLDLLFYVDRNHQFSGKETVDGFDRVLITLVFSQVCEPRDQHIESSFDDQLILLSGQEVFILLFLVLHLIYLVLVCDRTLTLDSFLVFIEDFFVAICKIKDASCRIFYPILVIFESVCPQLILVHVYHHRLKINKSVSLTCLGRCNRSSKEHLYFP